MRLLPQHAHTVAYRNGVKQTDLEFCKSHHVFFSPVRTEVVNTGMTKDVRRISINRIVSRTVDVLKRHWSNKIIDAINATMIIVNEIIIPISIK